MSDITTLTLTELVKNIKDKRFLLKKPLKHLLIEEKSLEI